MSENISAADGKVVSLAYTLWVDGQQKDFADANDPLVYLHGNENIIQGLEREITGMLPGEKKTVNVAAADGYGELMEDAIVELERSMFPAEFIPEIDESINLQDESEQVFTSFITSFDDNVLEVDLNHPLAGKDLKFDIEIIDVRDASEHEIEAGHIHSGCDCSGCESGCC